MQRYMRTQGVFAGLAVMIALVLSLGVSAAGAGKAYADDSLKSAAFTVSAQAGTEKGNATLISVNKKTAGTITTSNSEDWYRFKLKQAGKVQLVFGGEGGLFGSWKVTLYDSKSNEVWSDSVWRLNLKEGTVLTTGLGKGTYYVRIQEDIVGARDNMYYFTPKFTASSAWESEMNNAKATADAKKLGAKVNGNLQTINDEDWYKISIGKAGKFTITFGGDATEAVRAWAISLYNANEDLVYSGTYSEADGKDKAVCVSGLSKGTYYIRISNGALANGSNYHFKTKLVATTKWESESNDNMASANAIALNKTVNGNLQRANDEDWYAVSVKQVGKLRVAFGGDSAENGAWAVTLYNEASTPVATSAHAASSSADTLVIDQTVNTGTYYVRVSSTIGVTNLPYHLYASTEVPISTAEVTGISDVTYTGKAFKPVPTLRMGSATLTKGTDYTVKYKNNKNAGTATVAITGKGVYKGSIQKTFTIAKAKNTVTVKNLSKSYKAKASTGKLAKTKSFKLTASSKWNAKKVTFAKANKKGGSYIKVSKAGKVTVKKGLKAGTYKVKVKAKSKAGKNYKSASKTITVTVKVKK